MEKIIIRKSRIYSTIFRILPFMYLIHMGIHLFLPLYPFFFNQVENRNADFEIKKLD